MAYTYDDFLSAANGAGLLGEFSQADLDTARKYPEFGLSILSLKKDYHAATTDEQRLLANEAANELRSSYGNYTGSGDGSRYYSQGKIPGQIDQTLDRMDSFGSFAYDTAAPVYDSQYAARQQALLDQILNRPDFSWSTETDPLWPTYKKQYLREGERATANALAQTSAASGGRPSSYAATAASQAGDYYAAQLSDIIPTLYQQAYDRYLNEYSMKLQDLNAVNAQEQIDYAKYLDSLAQYNTDRNFAYNQHLDEYSMLQSTLAALQSQDAVDREQYWMEQQWKAQQDQTAYDRAWNEEVRNYERGMAAAELENQRLQKDFANALQMYQLYGYVPEDMAEILGLPAGTPTADQGYNDWYMAQQGAKMAQSSTGGGNISGGGNLYTGGLDPVNEDGNDYDGNDDIYGAVAAFQAGDHSDETVAALLAVGYTQADLEAAGYSGDYFRPSLSTQEIISATGINPDMINSPIQAAMINSPMVDSPLQATELSALLAEIQRDTTGGSDTGTAGVTNKTGDGWVTVPGYGNVTWKDLASMVASGEVVEAYDPATGKYTYRKNNSYKG